MPYLSRAIAPLPAASSTISSHRSRKHELVDRRNEPSPIPLTPLNTSTGTQLQATNAQPQGQFPLTVPASDDDNHTGYATQSPSRQKEDGSVKAQVDGSSHQVPKVIDQHKEIFSASANKKRRRSRRKLTLSGAPWPPITMTLNFDVLNPPHDPITPPSSKPVGFYPQDLGPNDVLIVPGKLARKNRGNAKLLELIHQFKVVYDMIPRSQKSTLTRSILLIIRSRDGRFLTLREVGPSTFAMYELGDEDVGIRLGRKFRSCGQRPEKPCRRKGNMLVANDAMDTAKTWIRAPMSTRESMPGTTAYCSTYHRPRDDNDLIKYPSDSLDYRTFNDQEPCINLEVLYHHHHHGSTMRLKPFGSMSDSEDPTYPQYNLIPRDRVVSFYKTYYREPHTTRPYDNINVHGRW
jgi:hypothetical protein